MNINYRCLRELEIKGLFETPEHRSRFSELLNCYCNYPFFNKGLCKCMYLSSWDMEHFIVMLDILNDMTIGKNQNLQLMEDNGKVLENMSDGYDRYISRCLSDQSGFPDALCPDCQRRAAYHSVCLRSS